MEKTKLKRKKYGIEIGYNTVNLVDENYPQTYGVSIPPRHISSVIIYTLPSCCGVKEVGNFSGLSKVPKTGLDLIAKAVIKKIDQEKVGMCLANFVKLGIKHSYQVNKFMEALKRVGFIEIGEHKNRRYRNHWIKTLAYIKHDNSYLKKQETFNVQVQSIS